MNHTNTPCTMTSDTQHNGSMSGVVGTVGKVSIIDKNKMDDANRKAIEILEKDGLSAAIKHMFTDKKTGRTLTYGEMRTLYG